MKINIWSWKSLEKYFLSFLNFIINEDIALLKQHRCYKKFYKKYKI